MQAILRAIERPTLRAIWLAASLALFVSGVAASREPHGYTGAGMGAGAGHSEQALAAAARSILGADQGVYIEAADGTVLLSQAAAKPVHPASVSKVATTLALLRKFGPDHRFITTFAASGHIVDGTLYGDLWVVSDGDPSFVDEDALLVAERLNQLGIRRVAGELRIRGPGPFTFDWRPDSDAQHLRQALAGFTPPAAWAAVQALATLRSLTTPLAAAPTARSVQAATMHTSAPLPAATPALAARESTPPQIGFVSAAQLPPGDVGSSELLQNRPLVVHRSQPLMSLLKALNDYSNNIFKPLADQAGGAAAVQALARSAVPADMRAEITFGDGAGTDPRNRLSPRAAVKLLRALDRQLAESGHALFDILPVAGVDAGTLQERLNSPQDAGRMVGKTGTYGSYGASALVGAIPTADHDTIYFAILDHGLPVPEARRRQDRLVQLLLKTVPSVPWNYQRDARPAIARAQVLMMP